MPNRNASSIAAQCCRFIPPASRKNNSAFLTGREIELQNRPTKEKPDHAFQRVGLSKQRSDQNSNRAPNWKKRATWRVVPFTLSLVTVPKRGSPRDVFGGANRAWLRALKTSARTSIRMPSLGT